MARGAVGVAGDRSLSHDKSRRSPCGSLLLRAGGSAPYEDFLQGKKYTGREVIFQLHGGRSMVSTRLPTSPPRPRPRRRAPPCRRSSGWRRRPSPKVMGRGRKRCFSSLLREAPAHPSRCQWHVGLLAAAELREPWGGALLAEGVRDGHLRSSGELEEGAACRAGEIYQELAEEECRDPAARCWPGEAAVRELRSCAQELRSSCDACFPAPSPVQPRTRQLHEALRFLAAPGAPAPAWSDAEVRLREAPSSREPSASSTRRRRCCATSSPRPCRRGCGRGAGAAAGHRGAPVGPRPALRRPAAKPRTRRYREVFSSPFSTVSLKAPLSTFTRSGFPSPLSSTISSAAGHDLMLGAGQGSLLDQALGFPLCCPPTRQHASFRRPPIGYGTIVAIISTALSSLFRKESFKTVCRVLVQFGRCAESDLAEYASKSERRVPGGKYTGSLPDKQR